MTNTKEHLHLLLRIPRRKGKASDFLHLPFSGVQLLFGGTSEKGIHSAEEFQLWKRAAHGVFTQQEDSAVGRKIGMIFSSVHISFIYSAPRISISEEVGMQDSSLPYK